MLGSWRGVWMVPLVALAIGAGTATLGEPVLGREQVIKPWGYALKTVDGWTAMTQQPGEHFIIGGWKADWMQQLQMRGDESWRDCQVTIVRVPLVSDAVTMGKEKTDEEEAQDAEREKLMKAFGAEQYQRRMKPKSGDDYLEGHWEGSSKRWSAKDVKAGKLAGKVLEFTSGDNAMCIGVFRDNNIDWLVVYQSYEEFYKKKWRSLFMKSIQTFRVFPAEGQANSVAPGIDMKDLKGDDKRRAIKAGISGLPGWYAVDTKNYVFLSNTTNKDFVASLAKDIETLREKVYMKLFPPLKNLDVICTARVLATQNDYYAYGGQPGTAGYWNSDKEELVLFDNFQSMSKKNSKEYTRSVMYHEAFHQYIFYAVGDVDPHSWYNEGHGDYFAGATISGGTVRIGLFDWRTEFLKKHLSEGKDLIPLKSLVRLPQSEYYTNGGLKYSQGWAFIYYLRQVAKDKRIREIPDIYFKHLTENVAAFRQKTGEKTDGETSGGPLIEGIPGIKLVNFEDTEKVKAILEGAVDKAFDGVDFDKLEQDFGNWVRTL